MWEIMVYWYSSYEILLAGLTGDTGATFTWNHGQEEIDCVRSQRGKLHNLREKTKQIENPAQIGIGHTLAGRHGKPEVNAHPIQMPKGSGGGSKRHCGKLPQSCRELKQLGHGSLGYRYQQKSSSPGAQFCPSPPSLFLTPLLLTEAVRQAVNKLQAFAIAVMPLPPDELIIARQQ